MSVALPQTAHSYAHASLRAQILSGQLLPGTALIQANLADQLGISMTPVREALRDLANEGLVTMTPHRGAVVTSVNLADALEIHQIRLRLEPEATAVAAERMTDEVLARVEDLYERMVGATGQAWVMANRDFHITVLGVHPSNRLKGILNSLLEAAALYVNFSMPLRQGEPQAEHLQILEALRAGDGPAAALAMTLHIQETVDAFESALD